MSNIVTTSIDENYPVAGQDNPSKGFRDNFQAIKTGLSVARQEITSLENKVLIEGDNDLSEKTLSNVTVRKLNEIIYEIDNTNAGLVVYDCSLSTNQIVNVTQSVGVFEIINRPSVTDREQLFKVTFVITDIAHTITFPGSFLNVSSLSGTNASGVITFEQTGTYQFEFSTSDNGLSFYIKDLSRNYKNIDSELRLRGNSEVLGRFYKDFDFGSNEYISVLEVDKIIASEFIGVEQVTTTLTEIKTLEGNLSATDTIIANTFIANLSFNGRIGSGHGTQPNITSLGTLTSLTVSGNASLGTNNSSTVNTLFGKTDVCGPMMTTIRKIEITGNGQLKAVNSTDNTIIFAPNPNVDNFSNISIEMPSGAGDGQRFTFIFSNTVSNIQWATSGNTWVSAEDTFGPTKGITLIAYEGFFYSA
jgi:hypothetical protein